MARLSSSLATCEQETIINFNECDNDCSLFTACPRRAEQLRKFAKTNKLPIDELDGGAVNVTIPKQWVRIRPNRKVSGWLSSAQK